MAFSDKVCRHFERPGAANTDAVIEAVSRRLEEGDVRAVVASISGKTGFKFAEKLHGKARIIIVSYERIPPRIVGDIKGLGGIVVDNAGPTTT